MTMGYTEDAHVATLFFHNHGPPFERGIDALQNLAHGLLLKYEEGLSGRYYRECCQTFREQSSEKQLYCPTCGSKVRAKFDLEDFTGWLVMLNGGTTDFWGGEFDGLFEVL